MWETLKTPSDIPQELLLSYEENKQHILSLLGETEFFHGTWAMSYDESWSINDSINDILENWIKPNEERLSDFFWISNKENLCLTRIWGYARVYASLFKSEEHGVEWEYKDRKWWIYMLAKEMIKEAIPSVEFWKKSIPRTNLWWKAEIDSFTWNKEWKSDRKSYWLYTMLYWKSDIASNFPVVIGVKQWADIDLEYPDLLWFRLFEARSISAIDTNNFSHLQVPLSKVDEVKQKLSDLGINIPVLAIEWCEIHDAHTWYTQLIEDWKNTF